MTGDAASQPRHVDLHAHSTASDGTATPTGAVEAAHRAGVVALALTDHDTLAGVPEAQVAAERLGLRLVPGVELSVHQEGVEVHLLGLHIRDVAGLQAELEAIRDQRRLRAIAMVEKLAAAGAPIAIEAVLAEAAGGAIGRPHVARALVAAGHVKDQREAFDRFLAAGRLAYVDKARLEIADGKARSVESGAEVKQIEGVPHAGGGVFLFVHSDPLVVFSTLVIEGVPDMDALRDAWVARKLAALGL